MNATVRSVHCSSTHAFVKSGVSSIRLIVGRGVEGDAHFGATVQHRSRLARTPEAPNLRQVHLMHAELLAELATAGFDVLPGQMGENITTAGLELLRLPRGTRLRLGGQAVVELTGLRNPCVQLDRLKPGLMKAVLGRDPSGGLVRKAGVMSIVLAAGDVRAGDPIEVEIPSGPHRRLEAV